MLGLEQRKIYEILRLKYGFPFDINRNKRYMKNYFQKINSVQSSKKMIFSIK